MPPQTEIPQHTADAIDAIRQLNERHEDAAEPIQKRVERMTQRFARPGTVIALLVLAALWMTLNAVLTHAAAPDPPPFEGLQVVLGMTSVTLTCFILTTQRRADILAAQRAHLTLELALVAEQKTAKTIALIEELRRDLPMLADRSDSVADALAEPTNASAVIESLSSAGPQKAPAGTHDSTHPAGERSLATLATPTAAAARPTTGTNLR